MKKTYIQPAMLAVMLQHKSQVMVTSIDTGDTGLTGGGSDDDYTGPVRVKQHNVWDEEW